MLNKWLNIHLNYLKVFQLKVEIVKWKIETLSCIPIPLVQSWNRFADLFCVLFVTIMWNLLCHYHGNMNVYPSLTFQGISSEMNVISLTIICKMHFEIAFNNEKCSINEIIIIIKGCFWIWTWSATTVGSQLSSVTSLPNQQISSYVF